MEILRNTLRAKPGGVLILHAVQTWTLQPSDVLHLNSPIFGLKTALDKAVASQNLIWWENFFRGLMSTDWGHIMESTESSTLRDANGDPAVLQWLALVICALQDYSLSLWNSRNEVLHEDTLESRVILQEQLHRNITSLYELGPTFSPTIQSYFSCPWRTGLHVHSVISSGGFA